MERLQKCRCFYYSKVGRRGFRWQEESQSLQRLRSWKKAQEHITSGGSTFETDKGYQQQTPWVGIANTNQKLMLQAASEFGLTPSSRSRIVAGNGKGKETEDEMEALLGDNGTFG